MSPGRASRAQHWTTLVAERFRPSHDALVAEHIARIEDPVNLEIGALLAEAAAKAAGVPYVPVPVEHLVAVERARLAGMTAAQILAEDMQEAAELSALLAGCAR